MNRCTVLLQVISVFLAWQVYSMVQSMDKEFPTIKSKERGIVLLYPCDLDNLSNNSLVFNLRVDIPSCHDERHNADLFVLIQATQSKSNSTQTSVILDDHPSWGMCYEYFDKNARVSLDEDKLLLTNYMSLREMEEIFPHLIPQDYWHDTTTQYMYARVGRMHGCTQLHEVEGNIESTKHESMTINSNTGSETSNSTVVFREVKEGSRLLKRHSNTEPTRIQSRRRRPYRGLCPQSDTAVILPNSDHSQTSHHASLSKSFVDEDQGTENLARVHPDASALPHEPVTLPSAQPAGPPTSSLNVPTSHPASRVLPSWTSPIQHPSSSIPQGLPVHQKLEGLERLEGLEIETSNNAFAPSHPPWSSPIQFSTPVMPAASPSIRPQDQPTSWPLTPTRLTSMNSNDGNSPSTTTTEEPSMVPSPAPSRHRSSTPSRKSSSLPSITTSTSPTNFPRAHPSTIPSENPSSTPTHVPTVQRSASPSINPSSAPSSIPSNRPTAIPTSIPSFFVPSNIPSLRESNHPSRFPTSKPSVIPTSHPTGQRSASPSLPPSYQASFYPSGSPAPSANPSSVPSLELSTKPSHDPSAFPSSLPSSDPSTSMPSSENMQSILTLELSGSLFLEAQLPSSWIAQVDLRRAIRDAIENAVSGISDDAAVLFPAQDSRDQTEQESLLVKITLVTIQPCYVDDCEAIAGFILARQGNELKEAASNGDMANAINRFATAPSLHDFPPVIVSAYHTTGTASFLNIPPSPCQGKSFTEDCNPSRSDDVVDIDVGAQGSGLDRDPTLGRNRFIGSVAAIVVAGVLLLAIVGYMGYRTLSKIESVQSSQRCSEPLKVFSDDSDVYLSSEEIYLSDTEEVSRAIL